MSAYITRWCSKHGEGDQDVDDPYEECPDCVSENIAPSQIAQQEVNALRNRIAELERERDEARKDADALRAGYPEGQTPADIAVLKRANLDLAAESERRAALLREWLDTELDYQDEGFDEWITSFTERVIAEVGDDTDAAMRKEQR